MDTVLELEDLKLVRREANPPAGIRQPFRTMEEAYLLSGQLARHFPSPAAAHHGLCEMLCNAIEHGNLGIGFEEKGRLMRSGLWQKEIDYRLQSSRWRQRTAEAELIALPDAVTVIIRDDGLGFEWTPFLALAPERQSAPNGRGIASAKLFAFCGIEYGRGGSEVRCTQKRRSHPAAPFPVPHGLNQAISS